MTAFDWITPLYGSTRDALADGQLVSLPLCMYGEARAAVEKKSWDPPQPKPPAPGPPPPPPADG